MADPRLPICIGIYIYFFQDTNLMMKNYINPWLQAIHDKTTAQTYKKEKKMKGEKAFFYM